MRSFYAAAALLCALGVLGCADTDSPGPATTTTNQAPSGTEESSGVADDPETRVRSSWSGKDVDVSRPPLGITELVWLDPDPPEPRTRALAVAVTPGADLLVSMWIEQPRVGAPEPVQIERRLEPESPGSLSYTWRLRASSSEVECLEGTSVQVITDVAWWFIPDSEDSPNDATATGLACEDGTVVAEMFVSPDPATLREACIDHFRSWFQTMPTEDDCEPYVTDLERELTTSERAHVRLRALPPPPVVGEVEGAVQLRPDSELQLCANSYVAIRESTGGQADAIDWWIARGGNWEWEPGGEVPCSGPMVWP